MFRQYPYHRLLNPLLFMLTIALGALSYFFLDKPVAEFFMNFSTHDFYISHVIHLMFKSGSVLCFLLALTVVAILDKKHPQFLSYMLILLVIFFAENIVVYFLKNMLGRSRPLLWLHEHIYGFFLYHQGHDYTSFPSGHTVNIALLTGFLAIVFKKYSFAIFSFGTFISFSRVWGDYHYLSDWFVTAYFVLCFIPVILAAVDKLPNVGFLTRIKKGASLLSV